MVICELELRPGQELMPDGWISAPVHFGIYGLGDDWIPCGATESVAGYPPRQTTVLIRVTCLDCASRMAAMWQDQVRRLS